MTAPTAPTMLPRQLSSAAMVLRESAFATLYHYLYNDAGVAYNQAGFTYEYSQTRGLIDPRIVASPTMEGRL